MCIFFTSSNRLHWIHTVPDFSLPVSKVHTKPEPIWILHQTGSCSFSWKNCLKTIPYKKKQSSLFNILHNKLELYHLCGNCIMKNLTSSFDPQ